MFAAPGLLVVVLLIVLTTAAAGASEPDSPAPQPAPQPAPTPWPLPPPPPVGLHWNEDWPRFRPVEYVVTGVVGPAAIAEYIVLPAQRQPHWTGGVLFDDAIRSA